MTSPEDMRQHPLWEGAVVGYLAAVERGLVSHEGIIPTMTQLTVGLVRQGYLADFGELQTYLREREADIQLIAHPFRPQELPEPGLRCVDVLTGEPRSHWLMVAVGTGGQEAAMQMQKLSISHEVNEATLATDTGILTI